MFVARERLSVYNNIRKAGEMTQWLKVLDVKARVAEAKPPASMPSWP